MADCTCIAGCLFFNDRMTNKPAMADMFKKSYCRGDNKNCARFQVFKAIGKEHVPVDLYPNETERARSIVATART